MLEREDRPSPLGAEQENCNSTATLRSPTDNNSSLLHEWPSPTCNNGSLILLETKSLNNSPLPHNQVKSLYLSKTLSVLVNVSDPQYLIYQHFLE